MAVILIGHKLVEIFAVADRILVLRRGLAAGERRPEASSHDEIVRLMVRGSAPQAATCAMDRPRGAVALWWSALAGGPPLDVAGWLEGLGLEQYAQAFADNAVDAALLPALTADDLKELGRRRGRAPATPARGDRRAAREARCQVGRRRTRSKASGGR